MYYTLTRENAVGARDARVFLREDVARFEFDKAVEMGDTRAVFLEDERAMLKTKIRTFTKDELETLVEGMEWAVNTYRAAAINSPEVDHTMRERREIALGLIGRFNSMREI